jgi:hypothetical protein
MNRDQIKRLMWFGFAFILLGLGSSQVWATQMPDGDTLQLRVEATTVYPGHFKVVSVSMQNPVPIQWFRIHITLGGWWEKLKFKTINVYDDTLRVPLDTCPDPDTLCTVDTCECDTFPGSPDTCACLVLDTITVRECYTDTVGSLISNFRSITCHGSIEDTIYHPDYITVTGRARDHQPIPASGNFRLLFKFGVDLSCLCDADSGRKIYFLISTGPYFTNFSDTMGYAVPFKYDPIGELFAWWSKPGDINNDSLVNASDVVYLINYLFVPGSPPPCVTEAADVDSNGHINASDVIYLQNYLFAQGPPPKRGYGCAKKEEE